MRGERINRLGERSLWARCVGLIGLWRWREALAGAVAGVVQAEGVGDAANEGEEGRDIDGCGVAG